MPHTYAPDAADLFHFLELPGDTVSDAQRRFLDSAVKAALAEFEGPMGCGRKILAPTSASQRTFDPPTASVDGEYWLPVPDMASATAPVVVYQPLNATAETLVADEAYRLEPQDASGTGKPYDLVVFYRRFSLSPLSLGFRRSLKITAKWGYSTTFPDDVWMAVLAGAASRLYAAGRLANTGGVLTWKDGDRSVEYGIQTTNALLEGWQAEWERTVRAYRKVTYF